MTAFQRIALFMLALTATLAAGCGDKFTPVSYVERARVLGARVSAASDSTRAWIKPGEDANVTWLMAARQDPTPMTWAFALCAGPGPGCAGAPLAMMSGQGAVPAATFTMPDQSALGSDGTVSLFGAICADGTLGFDPQSTLPTCTGDGASDTNVNFTVTAQVGDATNHHPVLADDLLQLDGADWPAGPMPAVDSACDPTTGLPLIGATPNGQTAVKHAIRMVSDGNDRETYQTGDPPVPTLEELQVSQFVTAGTADHHFADIPATDTRPDADVTLDWEPPAAKDVSAQGQVVQLHFVARDMRGGVDWIHRALCVVVP
jgi:hypothetical protein